jgi:hypothetical protein
MFQCNLKQEEESVQTDEWQEDCWSQDKPVAKRFKRPQKQKVM